MKERYSNMPMFSQNSDQSVLIILATGSERQKEKGGGRTILQEINNQAQIHSSVPSSQKQQTALATALKLLY